VVSVRAIGTQIILARGMPLIWNDPSAAVADLRCYRGAAETGGSLRNEQLGRRRGLKTTIAFGPVCRHRPAPCRRCAKPARASATSKDRNAGHADLHQTTCEVPPFIGPAY